VKWGRTRKIVAGLEVGEKRVSFAVGMGFSDSLTFDF
jgi:hypothetical protein